MQTFKLKHVSVPLFGVVDNHDQTSWHQTFSSASSMTSLQIDPAALDMIAVDLEIDAEGLALDAERYAQGAYRPKARGLGGGRLGDLGEVLVYLFNRALGHEIVRVVSWKAAAGQVIKGSLFPQPDFLIVGEEGLSALEVKSTEALDFVELRDTTKTWTYLQPCTSVAGCREKALGQLAYIGGVARPQVHQLILQDGFAVPFPSGKVVAAAILAVDGRVTELRSNKTYRTPKSCREARRSCWSCIPENCNFVLVTMQSVGGAPSPIGTRGGGPNPLFFIAYQRWAQALASRELIAARILADQLIQQLNIWFEGTDRQDVDMLRFFWNSYLLDAMRGRGFEVEVLEGLGDLKQLDIDVEWTPRAISEPISFEVTSDEIPRLLSTLQRQNLLLTMSVLVDQKNRNSGSISIQAKSDYIEFHLLSATWWEQGKVKNVDHAQKIVNHLLSFALGTVNLLFKLEDFEITLREVAIEVDERQVLIGWKSKLELQSSEPCWIRCLDFDRCSILCSWSFNEVLRTQIWVMPDGRAILKLPRTALNSL